MTDIRSFLVALYRNWASRVSGSLSVPFTIAAFLLPEVWARGITIAMAVSLAIVAAFIVWRVERKRADKLADDLKSSLEWTKPPFDCSLQEALHWRMDRSTAGNNDQRPDVILDDFRACAAQGRLVLWGRVGGGGSDFAKGFRNVPHQKVSAEFWLKNTFHPTAYIFGDADDAADALTVYEGSGPRHVVSGEPLEFGDLRVSRKNLELLWPLEAGS